MTNSTNKVIDLSFADSIKQLEGLQELLGSCGGNVNFSVASLQNILNNISIRSRAQGAFRKKDMEYIRQIIKITTQYQDITANALNLTIAFNGDEGAKLAEDKNI